MIRILTTMPPYFFVGTATYGLFVQAVQIPASGDVGSLLSMAEHLTLTGALIMAVMILWKSLVKKDAVLLESTRVVTAALASTTSANTELRKTVEDLKEAVENAGRK